MVTRFRNGRILETSKEKQMTCNRLQWQFFVIVSKCPKMSNRLRTLSHSLGCYISLRHEGKSCKRRQQAKEEEVNSYKYQMVSLRNKRAKEREKKTQRLA